MKILFLSASPRKTGYTAAVLKMIADNINHAHTIDWVHIYELDIKPCISCLKCRPSGSCVLPRDDGQRIAEKILASDALVIGSPTYFGNMSGVLKLLIERCLTAFEKIAPNGLEMPIPLHTGQKAAIVTACNIQYPMSHLPHHAKGTLAAIEVALKAGGYDIIGSIILDGAAMKTCIPDHIQEEAKQLALQIGFPRI